MGLVGGPGMSGDTNAHTNKYSVHTPKHTVVILVRMCV